MMIKYGGGGGDINDNIHDIADEKDDDNNDNV